MERNMEESRKQFEAWYRLNWGHTEDNEETMFEISVSYENYHRLGVRMAYDAWQASREAIEIELPSLKQVDTGERYVWSDGVSNFKGDAIEAIRAAGIKVKE